VRVIIFGSSGMLGRYVKKAFLENNTDVLTLTRNDIDLNQSYEKLFKYMHGILQVTSSDVIINCAGIVKQRKYNIQEMINVNTVFPQLLGNLKKSLKCNIIHISTDCVYSGRDGSYHERSAHDCTDEYGKTKSLGEHNLLSIIRTSIIGEEMNNKRSLLEWVKSQRNTSIPGFVNHQWNGVTCWELSKQIIAVVNNRLYWEGARHIYSPKVITKYQLISTINDIYELNNTVEMTKTHQICDRSLLSFYTSPVSVSIEDQIREQKIIGIP
jgi:dTDP-4-dehydrorhamnose reductase